MKKSKLIFLVIFMTTITFRIIGVANDNKPKIQIVLISLDALRADHLDCYGYSRITSPHISELAKDSILYKRAYPAGCWTMPSHMSILTGTHPSRHGLNSDWGFYTSKKKEYPVLNNSIKTIAELLNQKKVFSIKIANLPDEIGFARGFSSSYSLDPFQTEENFNILLKQLEDNANNNFLFFIHTWMIHAPYSNTHFLKNKDLNQSKELFINNYRNANGKNGNVDDFVAFLKENQMYNAGDCLDLYDGGIFYVDHYIGRIIEKCKKLNIYNNTLIILVSDHGEHFDDHFPNNFFGIHGWEFYEEFVKSVFIIKYPEKAKMKYPKKSISGTIDWPVSLVDVLPTIMEYYKIPVPSYVQGLSLLKMNEKRSNQFIFSEATCKPGEEKKMILNNHMKYIVTMTNPTGPMRSNWKSIVDRKLFNLLADPFEKNNLATDPQYKPVLDEYERKLILHIYQSAKTDITKKTKLDKQTIDLLKTLGYI